MAILYPDIDAVIIDYLKSTLLPITEYADTIIGVKKSFDDNANEVVIKCAYNRELTHVTRAASLIIEVYSPDFETANTLSLIVESLIREATVNGIKKVEVVLGPVRLAEASSSEKRSLSVDLVVKATQV